MSNLYLRSLTAIVLGCLVLWLTWLGGTSFKICVLVVGGFMLYEWIGITAQYWHKWHKIIASIFYAIFAILLLMQFSAPFVLLVMLSLALLLAIVVKKHIFWQVGGFIYASLPVFALSYIRGSEAIGFWVIIFLYAVVWTTDIAAYFTGRTIGGAKLAPRFSPNKTWSGALGGALFAVIGGLIIGFYAFDTSPNLIIIGLLALLLSIVSQIGDISESIVKRKFGVKDSSQLLPGHGGFMDRVDGLVFAAVILYFFGALLSDMTMPSYVFNHM